MPVFIILVPHLSYMVFLTTAAIRINPYIFIHLFRNPAIISICIFSTDSKTIYFASCKHVNYPLSKANGLPASQTSQPNLFGLSTISTGVNSGSPCPITVYTVHLYLVYFTCWRKAWFSHNISQHNHLYTVINES